MSKDEEKEEEEEESDIELSGDERPEKKKRRLEDQEGQVLSRVSIRKIHPATSSCVSAYSDKGVGMMIEFLQDVITAFTQMNSLPHNTDVPYAMNILLQSVGGFMDTDNRDIEGDHQSLTFTLGWYVNEVRNKNWNATTRITNALWKYVTDTFTTDLWKQKAQFLTYMSEFLLPHDLFRKAAGITDELRQGPVRWQQHKFKFSKSSSFKEAKVPVSTKRPVQKKKTSTENVVPIGPQAKKLLEQSKLEEVISDGRYEYLLKVLQHQIDETGMVQEALRITLGQLKLRSAGFLTNEDAAKIARFTTKTQHMILRYLIGSTDVFGMDDRVRWEKWKTEVGEVMTKNEHETRESNRYLLSSLSRRAEKKRDRGIIHAIHQTMDTHIVKKTFHKPKPTVQPELNDLDPD